MDNEEQQLHEMLERATSSGDEIPAEFDTETASLRETWLAFGKLLNASQSAPRMVALRKPERHSWLGQAIAIAASLLIVASLTALYWLRGEVTLSETPVVAQVDVPPEISNTDLDWGDSLDEEINAVSEAALVVRGDWYSQDGNLNAVEKGLEQIEMDMTEGTL